MEKKTTIADIAREVGVSKTTISRYLNGNYEYMSYETKKRIEAVIQKCNYVPNEVARTLKSKKSRMIGVIVNTLRYQVGAQTVTKINEVCAANGYGVIVCCSDDDPEKESQAIQLCLNQQVDGFVIIPCMESPERYHKLCERDIPVVLCTRRIANWEYGCIYVDHEGLIGRMVDHLKQQGFDKIRFILDVNNFHKIRMSRAFSQKAKELFGMEESESLVIVGRDNQEQVSKAIDSFLNEYPNNKKAIMAVNTQTLFLTLKELESRHMAIPDDIGVCGYDAQGWSELVYPGISSIRQPMDQMGTLAAEELMESIKEHRMSSVQRALNGTINFRASTNIAKVTV